MLFFVLALSSFCAGQIVPDRISDKILILNEGYFRSVAILTHEGVVLIDTREPYEKMEEIKKIVSQEFQTDTFCYIINSHGCPEHILGNPAFPGVPAIINENFFTLQMMYARQKEIVDSMEQVCSQINDTLRQSEFCSKLEERRYWRNICIKAMKINPDITYSEKMNLYFDELTIRICLTGLGHGNSSFIYVPEEKFVHVSTLSCNKSIRKYRIPRGLDSTEFLPYQIETLKEFIGLTDSLEFVVPGHGEYYSPDT